MIRNSGGTFAIFGAMVKLLYVVGSVVRALLCAQPRLEALNDVLQSTMNDMNKIMESVVKGKKDES